MDIYWQSSNWQNHNFNSRQTIAFVVSALLVVLFLLIPITYQYKFSKQDSLINVELVKVEPTPVKEEHIAEPIIEPTPKPVNTKQPKPKIKPKPIATPKPIPKIISITPKIEEPKLPSAGTIITSLRNRTHLQAVSEDFQVANDNDNIFIYKETVKKKPQLLVTNQALMHEIVNPKDPLALRLGKGLLNYLFVPIKDEVKSQDSLSYCPTLGRRSTFCPNANPLID